MSLFASERSLVKLAWSVFGFIALVYIADVVFSSVNASSMTISSWGSPGIVSNLLFTLVTFAFPLVGILVASRQPANSVGWVLLAIGLVWGANIFMDNYVGYAVFTNPGSLPHFEIVEAVTSSIWVPAIGLIVYLVLLFPDGHLPSPRWRPLARIMAACFGLAFFAIALAPGTFKASGYPHMTNPLGIDSLAAIWGVMSIFIFAVPIGLVASSVGLFKKFRRSRGQERAQMKWFVAAAATTASIALIVTLSTFGHPGTGWAQWAQDVDLLSFVLIPLATGVAILKYRLYEIDRIINRTLVYAILTAVLGAIYAGIVFGLQAALVPVARSSDLAVAASTLAVAGLFGPIRRRIQSFIDKRFYRSRFDAALTVDSFTLQLRDEIDLDQLSADLVAIARRTMQPIHASLWLRPRNGERDRVVTISERPSARKETR